MRRRKDDKENNYQQRAARRDAFLKLGMIFLGIMLIADTIQIARFGEIVERVDIYNKGVVDELGGFRTDITTFGNDMNEMRSVLLLPAKDYSFIDGGEEIKEADTQEASLTEQALYTFLTSYVSEKDMVEKATFAETAIKTLAADDTFKKALEAQELTAGDLEDGEFSVTFKISDATQSLFAVTADKKTGEIKIQSAAGVYAVTAAGQDELKNEIIKYASDNKEKIGSLKTQIEEAKSQITALSGLEEVKTILTENRLVFETAPAEDDEKISYAVLNEEGAPLLTITVQRADAKITMKEKIYAGADELKNDFISAIKELSGAPAVEQLISDRRTELESVLGQEAFTDMLKTSGLSVSTEPREDYNKLLYDVKDEEGKTIFSFVIELSSGNFKILKDNVETDLYSALQEGSKKKS